MCSKQQHDMRKRSLSSWNCCCWWDERCKPAVPVHAFFSLLFPKERGFSLSKLSSRPASAPYRETEALTKWRIITMSLSVFWRTLETGLDLKLSEVNGKFSAGITWLWMSKNIFCHSRGMQMTLSEDPMVITIIGRADFSAIFQSTGGGFQAYRDWFPS